VGTIKRQVNVFLASPGDLMEERKRARLVVEEVNTLIGESSDIRFELVGWEDTVSVFGRPQATINRELERCELFVGLMWRRWGTAPSTDGPFSSGFEEEFRSSVSRRQKSGSPEISLFFKEVSTDLLRDPGDELRKVLAFKKELIDQKYLLFEEFLEAEDFEKKLRKCLFGYINSARVREDMEDSDSTQPPSTELAKEPSAQPILSPSEEAFLRQLLLKTETNPLDHQDVARFRLLAARFRLQGNDELVVGVHDTNILFQFKDNLDLGEPEVDALVVMGLCHLKHENAPLWHWLRRKQSDLSFHTISGSSAKRAGAFRAMTILKSSISEEAFITRDFFVSSWLDEATEADDKLSALKYLAECGSHDDIPAIKTEIRRNDSRTTETAISAVVRIALRSGKEEALREIYSLEPSGVSEEILSELTTGMRVFETSLLREGLSLKARNLRASIVDELYRRQDIQIEESEALLKDEDLAIRRLAITHLTASGQTLSNDTIKGLLTRQTRNLMPRTSEEEWLAYRRESFKKLDKTTLRRMTEDESIFEVDVLLSYLEKDFKANKDALVGLVASQFRERFAAKLGALERVIGSSSDTLAQTKGLESYVRSGQTRRALDLLARKGGAEDISIVRRALESKNVDYSEEDSDYFRRFGEWKDIPLIIDSLSRDRRTSLLTIGSEGSTSAAARAIAHLGSHRLRELFDITMPPTVLAKVIAFCPDREFSLLRSEVTMSLLNNTSELVRKACALKCAKCLPKAKITSMLDSYVRSDSYRYYNVVHWLDFAVSLPPMIVRRTASAELKYLSR